MKKIVYLGADHRGFGLKEKIKEWLKEWGYSFEDEGAFSYNKDDDYPDFAEAVAKKVAGNDQKGIVICGSGIGVAMAANKIKGVRAGTAAKAEQAAAAVSDEDLNVLALSADYLGEEETKKIVKIFLETKFSEKERHVRRVDKINNL